MKVLELYSGIGGMHYALKDSLSDEACVVEAIDVNTVANSVYAFNFPHIRLRPKNVLSLKSAYIDELGVEMILMSPPCQPYTRLGKKEGALDKRSNSLSHFIKIISSVGPTLKYILLENVKGFETSDSRNELVNALKPSFNVAEFLLNPVQWGIPNSRERYYLLARREPFPNNLTDKLVLDHDILPSGTSISPYRVNEILEFTDDSPRYIDFLVPKETLYKRIKVMDIVTKTSERTCCFTKAYGRYIEGTGSVYCPLNDDMLADITERLKSPEIQDEHLKCCIDTLYLRFFTPKEVSKLMCFPVNFEFPDQITLRQRYNLLGNSINVSMVSTLIKILVAS